MILSRIWYVILGLVIGSLFFGLYLSQSVYNRALRKNMTEGLLGDSQVVSWYLREDGRSRASQLIGLALDNTIAKGLADAAKDEDKISEKLADQVKDEIKKNAEKIAEEYSFDAIFAVDALGRVVGRIGFEQAGKNMELGGFPVVADALHGNIRDDTLVLDRIYRVVARPVVLEVGALPVGAIVGFRIIDQRYVQTLSDRTHVATAFYAPAKPVVSAAPEGFDVASLDAVVQNLDILDADAEYQEKGRSEVHTVAGTLTAMYARMPGEAYSLGSGYAVARTGAPILSPLAFFKMADDTDKSNVNLPLVIALAAAAFAIGLIFSIGEHTKPLSAFRREALSFGKGNIDELISSRVRGVYREISIAINEGIEHAVSKGGGSRKAADLSAVLGDIPDQPQMSAFSMFGGDAPGSNPGAPSSAHVPMSVGAETPKKMVPQRSVPRAPGAAPAAPAAPQDPEAEWKAVYQDYLRVKTECGESTEGVTYEKFKLSLEKNRQTIIEKHGASDVKFSIYVKEGKAAVKANPVRS